MKKLYKANISLMFLSNDNEVDKLKKCASKHFYDDWQIKPYAQRAADDCIHEIVMVDDISQIPERLVDTAAWHDGVEDIIVKDYFFSKEYTEYMKEYLEYLRLKEKFERAENKCFGMLQIK